MRMIVFLLIILISISISSADPISKESEELSKNYAYRLAKGFYNIGSYQRATSLLWRAIKEVEHDEPAKQLLVDSYYDLICQIHIEYIELYSPEIIEGITKEAEKSVVDIFNKTKPSLRYWLSSKFYFFRGLFYTLLRNRRKANEDFINSLTYDPTNYKSLLWLVRNIVDDFPAYSVKIIKYIETFAEVMLKIKEDKTYQYILDMKRPPAIRIPGKSCHETLQRI